MNEEKEVIEDKSNSDNENKTMKSNNQEINNKPNTSETQATNRKEIGTIGLILLRFKWLLFGMIVGVIMCFVFYNRIQTGVSNVTSLTSSKINIDYLTGTLRTMSDLITSELEYQGLLEKTNQKTAMGGLYKEEEKYIMTYRAQIKAGIDLSKVTIEETLDKVIVTMPHATIKDKKVLPSTIKFYDIKKAFFLPSDGKVEAVEAQKIAEADVDDSANLNNLMNSAETQAKAVIKGLIEGIISDKEIVFNFDESDKNKINVEESIVETTESMGTE